MPPQLKRKHLKILELFAGTKSFSKVAEKRGHKTFTTDVKSKFECDLTDDIFNIKIKDIPWTTDVPLRGVFKKGTIKWLIWFPRMIG